MAPAEEFAAYLAANRVRWDEMAAVHPDSPVYATRQFLDGGITLQTLERDELGDVDGLRLLHVQCHFGLDTLSWARLGAQVTGVDFAPTAIETARKLAEVSGLPARFITSDVYGLPACLDETFDIVFTSYGVLCWLPDLTTWAEVVARYVRPGGTFYIADGHPTSHILDWSRSDELRIANQYFHTWAPERSESTGSYAVPEGTLSRAEMFEWYHPLGDIVTAIATVGLRVEFLHEFPFSFYEALPGMVEDEHGRWWPPHRPSFPFLFSLKASRPAG